MPSFLVKTHNFMLKSCIKNSFFYMFEKLGLFCKIGLALSLYKGQINKKCNSSSDNPVLHKAHNLSDGCLFLFILVILS